MRRHWFVLGWLLAALLSAAAQRAAAAEKLAEEKIRVLLVTGGHAFEQAPFFAVFDAMPDAVVTKAEYPAAAELLKPDLAQRCDVIVFYDMWAKGIAPQQQEALQQLLQSGIGVVALHHTLGAHQDWPEYTGAVFDVSGGRATY